MPEIRGHLDLDRFTTSRSLGHPTQLTHKSKMPEAQGEGTVRGQSHTS